MFCLLPILLLIISLPPDLAHVHQNPMQRQNTTGPSGISIVDFSYETRKVEEEIFEDTTSPNTSSQPDLPPGRVVRNPPVERTNERDLGDRMRDLRHLPTPQQHRPVRVLRFLFRAKMKNETSKPITRFVWSYQPEPGPKEIPGKQYVCNSRIEPNALKEVKVVSPIPRARVVSSTGAAQPAEQLTPALKDLDIKYVEFEDGSTWQHPEWNSTILLTRKAIQKLGKGKCITL